MCYGPPGVFDAASRSPRKAPQRNPAAPFFGRPEHRAARRLGALRCGGGCRPVKFWSPAVCVLRRVDEGREIIGSGAGALMRCSASKVRAAGARGPQASSARPEHPAARGAVDAPWHTQRLGRAKLGYAGKGPNVRSPTAASESRWKL